MLENELNRLKSNFELGKELDLYINNDSVGQGLPLLTSRGATIKRELERFIVDEELKRGYQHTSTPIIAKSDLYKISGHWDLYRDSMFQLKVGEEEFALRPMTCPFQFVIYKSKPRSYRDLPIRYAELATLFRNEKSGTLMGLTRLRQFTLSDGHIVCAPEQLESEFKGVLDLINFTTKTLGIEGTWNRFSKWNPKNKGKYIDNPLAWEESQKSMKNILNKAELKYEEAEGEAAFYGPKLDIQYKNVFGKEDTLITVQIDFALPERFDMKYTDSDGKEKRPMVIHRSSIGCLERTMAYLLEKTQGNLPLWLSPTQVKILGVNNQSLDFVKNISGEIRKNEIRSEFDNSEKTLSSKIKSAELMKVPYMVIIGDREREENVLSIRKKGTSSSLKMDLNSFIFKLREEIKNK
jgi:threonyl-tRNA synthetase